MKKTLAAIMAVTVVCTACASAEPNGTFLGALLGAGGGLVLANNVDGVHREWAVPAMALAGGWLGHEFDKHNRWRNDYQQGYCYHAVVPIVVQPEQPKVDDPHPGVDLIKVSIMNSNGVRTDVNILRVGGKFVGPRGESYESLPTSEALAKKYGM